MSRIITFLLLLVTAVYSQQGSIIGHTKEYRVQNGIMSVRTETNNNEIDKFINVKNTTPLNPLFNAVRWYFEDPVAIADKCATSGNGLYQVVGYGLNSERISVYGNTNSTPLWEHMTDPNVFVNYVAINDDGNYIAGGSYRNIYVWNRSSSTPVMNFDVNSMPNPGNAGPVDITSNGTYIIASVNGLTATDSSIVLFFNRNSNVPVWTKRVGAGPAGGSSIQGVKFSGNDSLVIVNNYLIAWVFKTYTGEELWTGLINTGSNSGTQFPQGISGNGSRIGLINYSGQVRILQWNGTTYNPLWTYQESGAWQTSIDFTYDGSKVAAGTLNFLGGSNYDGKVRLWNVSGGNVPVWTYTGMGDEVNAVEFSKNAAGLIAVSWGDYGTNIKDDFIVFRVSDTTGTPMYTLNGTGSFFSASISNDGSTVIASGKRVHARQFGNGAQVYNVMIDSLLVGVDPKASNPVEFELSQNYPNPFNPVTSIYYTLNKRSDIMIVVYDMLGREVKVLINSVKNPGRHGIEFDASSLTSGVYFYRLIADGKLSDTKKMTLVK